MGLGISLNSPVVISNTWTDFKSIAITSKLLPIQYGINTNTDHQNYIIFAIDGDITYTCNIWLGLIPSDALSYYSQTQNDSDKADWESNFLPTANGRLTPGLNQTPVLVNATITADGSQTFSGYNGQQVILFINITQFPGGINSGLIFSLQQIDPGDLVTPIGQSVSSELMNEIETQQLVLDFIESNIIQVSWVITGSNSVTFTGVYVTLSSNNVNYAIGPSAAGSEMIGNPVIIGSVDSSSNAQAISSVLSNGYNQMRIYDEKTHNKLDQIIMLLTDIVDTLKDPPK